MPPSLTLLSLLMALITCSHGAFNIVPKSRLAEKLKQPPYNSIGWFSRKSHRKWIWSGTGWVTADKKHVVTAGHVAMYWNGFDPSHPNNGKVRDLKSLRFHIGDKSYTFTAVDIADCWKTGPLPKPDSLSGISIEDYRQQRLVMDLNCDYAVYTLSTPIESASGFAFAPFADLQYGPYSISWAGYPHLQLVGKDQDLIEKGDITAPKKPKRKYAGEKYGYKAGEPPFVIADSVTLDAYKANKHGTIVFGVFTEPMFEHYDGAGSSGAPWYVEYRSTASKEPKYTYVAVGIMRGSAGVGSGKYYATLIRDEVISLFERNEITGNMHEMMKSGASILTVFSHDYVPPPSIPPPPKEPFPAKLRKGGIPRRVDRLKVYGIPPPPKSHESKKSKRKKHKSLRSIHPKRRGKYSETLRSIHPKHRDEYMP